MKLSVNVIMKERTKRRSDCTWTTDKQCELSIENFIQNYENDEKLDCNLSWVSYTGMILMTAGPNRCPATGKVRGQCTVYPPKEYFLNTKRCFMYIKPNKIEQERSVISGKCIIK